MAPKGDRLVSALPPEFHPMTVQQNYVSDRTVALLLPGPSGKWGVASSTCIRIGERCLLITAGHVFNGYASPSAIQLLPAGSTGATLSMKSAGRSTDHVTRFGEAVPDVGWIEVSCFEAKLAGLRMLQLSDLRLDQQHDGGQVFLVQGYPFDEVLQDGKGAVSVCSTGAGTYSLDSVLLPSHADRSAVFAVEWPPHDFKEDGYTPPLPPGISGGGVWAIPHFEDGRIWDASEARLVAINRVWWKPTKMLSTTPVRPWLVEVAGAYPDLKPEIDTILGAAKSA